MKNHLLSTQKSLHWPLFVSAATAILATLYFIINSQLFTQDNTYLTLGVTLDFVLTIPLLYYILMIRTKKMPWASILVLYLFVVLIASIFIPKTHQTFLHWFEMSLILTEGLLVTIAIFKIRSILAQYRIEKSINPDFIIALNNTITKVLGRSIPLMVSEIAMFHYTFLFWKLPVEALPHHKIFTVHKKSAAPALIGALIMATVVEMIAVHVLVSRWNETVALVLLFLSAYSLIFLIGYAISIVKRPVLLDNNQLLIRIGAMYSGTIHLNNIKSIQLVKKIDEKDKSILNLASFLLVTPNIVIELNEPVTFTGVYNIKKTTLKVALFIDDKVTFSKIVE